MNLRGAVNVDVYSARQHAGVANNFGVVTLKERLVEQTYTASQNPNDSDPENLDDDGNGNGFTQNYVAMGYGFIECRVPVSDIGNISGDISTRPQVCWTAIHTFVKKWEAAMENTRIRNAVPEDARLILGFIKELAKFEKMEDDVVATVEGIHESLFSEGASASALICSMGDKPIGYAIYFFNYSTWLGKNGLYLEDLYISPEYRSNGAGKAVLKYLAKVAVDKGCGRFEWSVLDWNEPAIQFYEGIGAKQQKEWILYRLDGGALTSFAGS